MAKEAPTLEVHLVNDWFSGSRLLRKVDNPHFLPEQALEFLPTSAKLMIDDELVPVDEKRSNTAEAQSKKLAETEGKETAVVTGKGLDLTKK